MIKLHSQQHIRLYTRHCGTTTEVYAVLFETQGSETFAISEPKLVKVIHKKVFALKGAKQKLSPTLSLGVSSRELPRKISEVVSPYISSIFGFINADFIAGLSARPPTLRI
jgi:hypothetical protein